MKRLLFLLLFIPVIGFNQNKKLLIGINAGPAFSKVQGFWGVKKMTKKRAKFCENDSLLTL